MCLSIGFVVLVSVCVQGGLDDMAITQSETHQPVDAIAERLNDPAVAASLVTLLDNAELLSTLVLGLGGFVERGDLIMDAVADGVNEFKASGAALAPEGMPSVAELSGLAGQLAGAAPLLTQLLDSAIVKPEMISLLNDVSEAATEGAENARKNETTVSGIRGTLKTLKDPEVAKGLGLLVEIARSLGRRMD